MAKLPRVTLAFGTRPEAIEMAAVVRAFRADPRFAPRVVVAGQHRQMLDAVLATFEIAPDADLNVMTPDQSLAGLTARTLTAFDAELRDQLVGNTVVDALHLALARLDRASVEVPGLPPGFLAGGGPLVLVTGHRRENFGPGFEAICHAVADLARLFPAARFVYPVYLNPNVRGPVGDIVRAAGAANVALLEPLGDLEFLTLFRRAAVVLSDSGGVQEEAPTLGKRVVPMRDATERPEAVASGHVQLVGPHRERIVAAASAILNGSAPPLLPGNPYGHAAAAIADACRVYSSGVPA
jgi:UDP-N-acetylglucosamine 2-epimerase